MNIGNEFDNDLTIIFKCADKGSYKWAEKANDEKLGKKEFKKLRELIYSSAEVKNQILSYERKIQANEQVYQWYSKKLIKSRKEKQTMEQALKYIAEHRENLEASKKVYEHFWLEMQIMQKE